MKVRLELAHKKAKVKKVWLQADTVIGRSTECGLRIASNEVSRQHCKICIREDGVTVRDLGSSNGTFVNGYQLEPDTDYEIAPDSELSLGGIKFFVRFSEPVAKRMQADGLGSTIDLKPSHQEESPELEQMAEASAANETPAAEETPFAEASEAEEEQSVEEPAPAETATVRMSRPADLDSANKDSDLEMTTHGDSAILERDEDAWEEEAENVAADEEVVDLELEEEPADEPLDEEVVDLELEDDSLDEEVVDLELEEMEPAKAADETADEAKAPAEDEEAVHDAGEDESQVPVPADEETGDEDVASFLNQVADDEEAAEEEDESLGDFFKQFD